MLKKIFIVSGLFLFLLHSEAQTNKYRFSIDSLIKSFEFVYIKPIQKITLEKKLIREYEEFLEGSGKSKVDTSVLFEIIENSSRLDTSHWQDAELKKAILIKNKNESISSEYVFQKFNFLRKKDKKRLKKTIAKYNNADIGVVLLPGRRIVTSYSRTVFDNSGRHAVVS